MSEKYARQVRRELARKNWEFHNQVKESMKTQVQKQSFFKRLKIAFLYVFKKRCDFMWRGL